MVNFKISCYSVGIVYSNRRYNMSEQKTRYIPKNVLQSTKIFGLKKRNLIEGIIWAVALCLLINLIPFVLKVKIILFVTVTLVSLLLNGMGIHENAISATVLAYLQYHR